MPVDKAVNCIEACLNRWPRRFNETISPFVRRGSSMEFSCHDTRRSVSSGMVDMAGS